MSQTTTPSAKLSHLNSSDGSATFTQNGYTVIGSVSGPIEVQRRDELAEEAVVDVVVRPVIGVGSIRERHLETILQSTLCQIILIHNHPRTLIQVTLQVTSTPENETVSAALSQSGSVKVLAILPALLQTSVLALLSASIPLSAVLTSTIIVISSSGGIIRNPNPQQLLQAGSIHVLAFSSHGDLLVVESEGEFTMGEWDDVYEAASEQCRGPSDSDEEDDVRMDTGEAENMESFMKSILQEKVSRDLQWRQWAR